MSSLEERIEEELRGKSPDEVVDLVLDNSISGGSLDGLSSNFVNLEYLSVNSVGLHSLGNFPTLLKLRKLELAENRIVNGLDKLQKCRELQSLCLTNNRIKNIQALEPLTLLPNLFSLDLDANPIAKEADYPDSVFDLLPKLVYLDDKDRNGQPKPSDDEDDEEEGSEENEYDEEDEEEEGEEEPAAAAADEEEEEENEEAGGEESEEEEEEGGLEDLQKEILSDDDDEADFEPEGAEEEGSEDIDDEDEEEDDKEASDPKRRRLE